jgi:hypothetical protein
MNCWWWYGSVHKHDCLDIQPNADNVDKTILMLSILSNCTYGFKAPLLASRREWTKEFAL